MVQSVSSKWDGRKVFKTSMQEIKPVGEQGGRRGQRPCDCVMQKATPKGMHVVGDRASRHWVRGTSSTK